MPLLWTWMEAHAAEAGVVARDPATDDVEE